MSGERIMLPGGARLIAEGGARRIVDLAGEPCCETIPPVGRSIFLGQLTLSASLQWTRVMRTRTECGTWESCEQAAAAGNAVGPYGTQITPQRSYGSGSAAGAVTPIAVETVGGEGEIFDKLTGAQASTAHIEATDALGVFHTWPLTSGAVLIHATASGDRLTIWSTARILKIASGVNQYLPQTAQITSTYREYNCTGGCFPTGPNIPFTKNFPDDYWQGGDPWIVYAFRESGYIMPLSEWRGLQLGKCDFAAGSAYFQAVVRTADGSPMAQPATKTQLLSLLASGIVVSATLSVAAPTYDYSGCTPGSARPENTTSLRHEAYSGSASYGDPLFFWLGGPIARVRVTYDQYVDFDGNTTSTSCPTTGGLVSGCADSTSTATRDAVTLGVV